MGVKKFENIVAVFIEFTLNLVLVVPKVPNFLQFFLLFLSLDGGKGPPGTSA